MVSLPHNLLCLANRESLLENMKFILWTELLLQNQTLRDFFLNKETTLIITPPHEWQYVIANSKCSIWLAKNAHLNRESIFVSLSIQIRFDGSGVCRTSSLLCFQSKAFTYQRKGGIVRFTQLNSQLPRTVRNFTGHLRVPSDLSSFAK